mmetsp:Transcript_95541/g.270092  ORF Transcript_95541/g.270092 Transcript_95541/m.270092 type:complete len:406 (+) Transcript_95541:2189-3406(+)
MPPVPKGQGHEDQHENEPEEDEPGRGLRVCFVGLLGGIWGQDHRLQELVVVREVLHRPLPGLGHEVQRHLDLGLVRQVRLRHREPELRAPRRLQDDGPALGLHALDERLVGVPLDVPADDGRLVDQRAHPRGTAARTRCRSQPRDLHLHLFGRERPKGRLRRVGRRDQCRAGVHGGHGRIDVLVARVVVVHKFPEALQHRGNRARQDGRVATHAHREVCPVGGLPGGACLRVARQVGHAWAPGAEVAEAVLLAARRRDLEVVEGAVHRQDLVQGLRVQQVLSEPRAFAQEERQQHVARPGLVVAQVLDPLDLLRDGAAAHGPHLIYLIRLLHRVTAESFKPAKAKAAGDDEAESSHKDRLPPDGGAVRGEASLQHGCSQGRAGLGYPARPQGRNKAAEKGSLRRP